jgi:hypothetical protein
MCLYCKMHMRCVQQELDFSLLLHMHFHQQMMHMRTCAFMGKISAFTQSVPRSSVEELKRYTRAYGPTGDAHDKNNTASFVHQL